MITAVDTSVLIDVLEPDPVFGTRSADALRRCLGEGRVIACEVVWAETSAAFPSSSDTRDAMDQLRVEFSPIQQTTALSAGDSWRAHRAAGGGRDRVLPDFLIGAHAASAADRLLTRDRGFYRRYFEDLDVLDPTRPPS